MCLTSAGVSIPPGNSRVHMGHKHVLLGISGSHNHSCCSSHIFLTVILSFPGVEESLAALPSAPASLTAQLRHVRTVASH